MPAGCILAILKKQARFILLVLHLIVLPFSPSFLFLFVSLFSCFCLLLSDSWYTEYSTECLSTFLNTTITFQNSAADATTLYVSSFSLLLFLSLFSLLDFFHSRSPTGTSVGTQYPCAAGYYMTAGKWAANQGSPCSPGYYCTQGSPSPTQYACAAGTYCPATSQTANGNGDCPAGYYCLSGADRQACAAGTYCPVKTGAAPAANSCTPGYYCAGGGTDRVLCQAGTWCPIGQSAPAGQGSCPEGHYCLAGSDKIECDPGTVELSSN
jgi:hypothetical protein